jgi:cytochrome c oxidase cbb3-type subunit 1
MITIGSLYAMAPRALGRPAMHSTRAMNLHFWLHITGLVLYLTSMWTAGITEGVMWRATNPDGTLAHSFLASLIVIQPYYAIRFVGGVLVLTGMVVMAWNLWYTASDARERLIKPIIVPIPEPEPLQVPAPLPATR